MVTLRKADGYSRVAIADTRFPANARRQSQLPVFRNCSLVMKYASNFVKIQQTAENNVGIRAYGSHYPDATLRKYASHKKRKHEAGDDCTAIDPQDGLSIPITQT